MVLPGVKNVSFNQGSNPHNKGCLPNAAKCTRGTSCSRELLSRRSSKRSIHQNATVDYQRTEVVGLKNMTSTSAKNPSSPTIPSSPSSACWPCKGGQLVRILQETEGEFYRVHIQLTGVMPLAAVEVQWGIFRSDPSQWQHPDGTAPPESRLDPATGAMVTPMKTEDGFGGYSLSFELPIKLAPSTFAFLLRVAAKQGKKPSYVKPLRGTYFTTLLGALPGLSSPLGPSLTQKNVNFALRCRGAEHVNLVLMRAPAVPSQSWKIMDFTLNPSQNKTGDTWHVSLPELKNLDSLFYGWRVQGDVSWDQGNRINPEAILLDPYAQHVAFLPPESGPPQKLTRIGLANGSSGLALSSLAGLSSFKPINKVLHAPLKNDPLSVLEIDVASFSPTKTFLGLIDRVPEVASLGFNAVVLTPCYATARGGGPLGKAAVSYMAPDPTLSSDPINPLTASNELKRAIRAFQEAGIAVIVSFDLTFTAEGTDESPSTLSLRGLDYSGYYRPNAVLNCGKPAVHHLVMSTVHSWAKEYGVDGFHFVNAENMVQDSDGFILDAPPLVEALAHDPLLADLMLLATPGDDSLLPRGGSRGFPHWGVWSQVNSAFVKDMQAYLVHGTGTSTAQIATRLAGSTDIFDVQSEGYPGCLGTGRRPWQSFIPAAPLFEESATMSIAKSLLTVSILAAGTPMISQDWIKDPSMAAFVQKLLTLKHALSPLLSPPKFDSPRTVRWHTSSGGEPYWGEYSPDESTYSQGGCEFLGMSVWSDDGTAAYLGMNPMVGAVLVDLPHPPEGYSWLKGVDSGVPAPEDAVTSDLPAITSPNLSVSGKAVILLMAGPLLL